jgi:hypothetical protein
VRQALATLPWVEQDSIQFDARYRLVRFRVKDKSLFSREELDAALKKQKADYRAEQITGPTDS